MDEPVGHDDDDLISAFAYGLELLGQLIIDNADDPDVGSILQRKSWLTVGFATELLISLDEKPVDALHRQFIYYDIPVRRYQWPVATIQQHKAWYPNDEITSYDRLMNIAERFGLQSAEKA